MTTQDVHDWDPRSAAVQQDQITAYDELRRQCPVAHSDSLHWSLFRHGDAMQALRDPESFSNAVSAHVSVPNGMDPPAHTVWRHLIEPYFGPAPLAAFEPACRRIARQMIERLPVAGDVEWMEQVARDCALQMLCAFMGWPAALHQPLREWARRNHAATLAQDRTALAAIAFEFDGHIRTQLAIRKAAGAGTQDDVTSRLMRERVDGRALDDAEIVSIVRNWTVGELATMAASFGIVAGYLARHPDLQQALREQPDGLPAAIDEILRMDAPLIANRRVVRKEVDIGDVHLDPGDRVSLMWASANRDEAVFGDPDEFRPERDPALNLLYGAGIHACPGAPLARMQLRIVTETLLAHTRMIAPAPGWPPVRAHYPAGGFSALPLWIERT